MLKHRLDTAAALAQRFLEPGDAVIEIGAADGAYTRCYAERVGPTGEVVAVEPHARHVATLRRAVEPHPWVTVWAAAVGASVGTALFYSDRRRPQMSSLYAANVDRPGPGVVVPLTTIDMIVQGMRQTPALIQVDAQGAEAEILRGAVRTLDLPIAWIIEVWPSGVQVAGASVADVLGPFEARGYQPETAHGSMLTWADARHEVTRIGCVQGGHLDLVMVPALVGVPA